MSQGWMWAVLRLPQLPKLGAVGVLNDAGVTETPMQCAAALTRRLAPFSYKCSPSCKARRPVTPLRPVTPPFGGAENWYNVQSRGCQRAARRPRDMVGRFVSPVTISRPPNQPTPIETRGGANVTNPFF